MARLAQRLNSDPPNLLSSEVQLDAAMIVPSSSCLVAAGQFNS
ncbi:hypothetical protein Slin15195_G097410 [Septoria linicola]|uniref:Uncharacterized protein n=1 Tax=Septoria linicola TaxID=215465 RepID=A0A9Q9AV28_9PEZI|nr:hypothetical protein Slin15195_G097410 [Septoria linicola]